LPGKDMSDSDSISCSSRSVSSDEMITLGFLYGFVI